jgi:hypothetical protein
MNFIFIYFIKNEKNTTPHQNPTPPTRHVNEISPGITLSSPKLNAVILRAMNEQGKALQSLLYKGL